MSFNGINQILAHCGHCGKPSDEEEEEETTASDMSQKGSNSLI